MYSVKRSEHNPLLSPVAQHPWEADAVFNWCPVQVGGVTHVLYRAIATTDPLSGMNGGMSTIGHAVSSDGVHFKQRRQFIVPEHDWERYGCEDPRVTRLGDTFYIFYTALSTYPFVPEGIKVAMATTKDFKTILAKHLVTPFNAKAMVLFPERINGQMVALLTVHTDQPPAKIALARFNRVEDMWSQEYWDEWHQGFDQHTIDLRRSSQDHVEVGAPPVKTKDGWLLIYSYIQKYFTPYKLFGIEALLLDLKDPRKIVGRTRGSLLVPETQYELMGHVPNIVFPSGSRVRDKTLDVFYGAVDTTCCLASVNVSNLLRSMQSEKRDKVVQRLEKNPIITPDPSHDWEAKATFNPAAINLHGKIHILYRAMSADNTSTIGYAASRDGMDFDERLPDPVYVPREDFEKKAGPGNSGCEDPRIVKIGSRLYMTYTAVDAAASPRVAISSIDVNDFLAHEWNWSRPQLISPPGIMDKDTCLFPEKIHGDYMFLHRIGDNICAEFIDSLDFEVEKLNRCIEIMRPRPGMWDSKKIGIAAPPLECTLGWLLLYHGVSEDSIYRVGAALLDKSDPTIVLARTADPILEPVYDYEKEGQVSNVVFPGGAVRRGDTLFIYYGGADSVVGGAIMSWSVLLDMLE